MSLNFKKTSKIIFENLLIIYLFENSKNESDLFQNFISKILLEIFASLYSIILQWRRVFLD